jgi:hypothetical protein
VTAAEDNNSIHVFTQARPGAVTQSRISIFVTANARNPIAPTAAAAGQDGAGVLRRRSGGIPHPPGVSCQEPQSWLIDAQFRHNSRGETLLRRQFYSLLVMRR